MKLPETRLGLRGQQVFEGGGVKDALAKGLDLRDRKRRQFGCGPGGEGAEAFLHQQTKESLLALLPALLSAFLPTFLQALLQTLPDCWSNDLVFHQIDDDRHFLYLFLYHRFQPPQAGHPF